MQPASVLAEACSNGCTSTLNMRSCDVTATNEDGMIITCSPSEAMFTASSSNQHIHTGVSCIEGAATPARNTDVGAAVVGCDAAWSEWAVFQLCWRMLACTIPDKYLAEDQRSEGSTIKAVTQMVRASAAKAHRDVTEVKRRVSTALERYAAFAGAVKRADVSAQSSGAKILEGLAHVAAQEQLLLRNSPDLRRYFAAAINKTDLAALLRSPAIAVQLAALRASNTLSQHIDFLPSSTMPFIVRHLQSPDGASELAVSTLQHLMRPLGPSNVWQAIHDGKGKEMLIVSLETWANGGSSAAPHLQLLCFLLKSSLAAQRQLLEDACLAARWTRGLLKVLQQPLSSNELQLAAAAVHAVSAMSLFVQHVQADTSQYCMLTQAAACALQAGNRQQWSGAADSAHTACDLLDSLAGLTPPHVCHASQETPFEGQASILKQGSVQRHCDSPGSSAASQLAHALQELLPNSRTGLEVHSLRHQVLSAALKAMCVLLLPPHFLHGSGARASPWLKALGPTLPSRLVALLSKDGTDIGTDTWCWQALYLLQAHLSPSQQDQILQHPTAQRIPPTSILTLEPLFCSYSALRVILACRSTTRANSASRHYVDKDVGIAQAASVRSQPFPRGSQSPSIGNSSQSMGNSSLSSQSARKRLHPEGPRWPNNQQGQRHHLLLPKALPQGNLSRYFDLACVTSGLRCLDGQQDAWEDAWLVLQHALDILQYQKEPIPHKRRIFCDGDAWTSAVITSLQALTEAGATGSLPSHICTQLAQLAATHSGPSYGTASTAVSPSELAYSDRHASSGRNDVRVPPPLQQQENTQLRLWWAVATAAACGQLGLPSQLGATMQGVLADDSTADVAFELQSPFGETIMAHAAIIAAGCPKLYQAVQQQRHEQQQHEQQQHEQQQQGHHQQRQQQCSAVDSALHIQLGRSVMANPFRQVIEYLYTGQVLTLSSDEEGAALRRLAHALELPQLAALAAGRRPSPGAEYTFLKLAEIVPKQHLQIPWVSFITNTDRQKVTEQLQNKSARHEDEICPGISVSDINTEGSEGLCRMDSGQHPSIHDLHAAEIHVQLPDRLPVPTNVPAHLDLLLVPRQCNQQCRSCGSPSINIAAGSACEHVWKSSRSVATGQEVLADATVIAPQQCLQALPAHRAILSATSPYFAAMLSDRWHAGSAVGMPCSDMQDANRYLLAAHLPNEDAEVLSAFVRFCYTHELELQPCGACDVEGAPANGCTVTNWCWRCWNARTAVRLCVAAEAWMVPMLQEQCLAFLMAELPALPSECQDAVQADMTAMHAWDLAHQLSIALGVDRI